MPVFIFLSPNAYTGVPPKVTTSDPMIPVKAAVPVAVAIVFPSYSLLAPERPVMVKAIAVISPVFMVKFGMALYFPASVPDSVYPTVMVLPVPTFLSS